MFLGRYEHTIDSKGRLAIPARYRGRLEGGLVITQGYDDCLWIFPRDVFQTRAEKLRDIPEGQADARTFERLVFINAVDGEMDSQGRVVIPIYLRDYGRLQNDVVVAGVNTRLEVWNAARFQEILRKLAEQASVIAEQSAKLRI